LSAQLPPRERLIVRARYEQLVRDRLDSALAYWHLVAKSYPDEPLAYEGMWWVYRAMSDYPRMAAAAESAYRRDSTEASHWRYVEGRLGALILARDSAGVFAFAGLHGAWAERMARDLWARHRGDWPTALALTSYPYHRHTALLAMGRLDDAAHELEAVRRGARAQDLPRALLLQARAELAPGGSRARARALAREALTWIAAADLSAPAYARLAERTADVAARAGDAATVAAVRRLVETQDAGRRLPSYVLALRTVDACAAFARGEMAAAAELASRAWPGMFYGRSVGTVVLLEADARAASGTRVRADSLYRALLTPLAFPDGDHETLAVLRRDAARALGS